MNGTPLSLSERVSRAIAALAVDPSGLGGLWLRARSGPARDSVLSTLASVLPHRRIGPDTADSQLFGSVNVAETIALGREVREQGLLSTERILAMAMAERCSAVSAGRFAQWIDVDKGCLIALDEGADAEERLPSSIADRLALHLDLDGVRHDALTAMEAPQLLLEAARGTISDIPVGSRAMESATRACAILGCEGLRAPILLLRTARALAALDNAPCVSGVHVEEAAGLVLPPRATTLPHDDDDTHIEPEVPQDKSDASELEGSDQANAALADRVLDAVASALPDGVLKPLESKRRRSKGAGMGAGNRIRGKQRGRPLPPRAGHADGVSRIDIVSTLRAAAPWQPLRRSQSPKGHSVHIRSSDIRVRRFEQRTDRVLVFCVDASGSSAMARMAEAKGAVELLLAEAYARRDHVSLIAFRGSEAEELLPPTRSLVQTKRRLSALPGGGGTPLAAGLEAGLRAALTAERHGLAPALILLTDGKANIARDGTPDRRAAREDSEIIARQIHSLEMTALVIDTGTRPNRDLCSLSTEIGADYLPLPRADAVTLSKGVSTALKL